MVTDVFTREAVTRALPNKNAETVARAAAEAIPDLVQEEGNYVVTTDEGNEFRTLEANLPQGGGATARSGPRTGTPPPWWTAPSRPSRRTWRAKMMKKHLLQRSSTRTALVLSVELGKTSTMKDCHLTQDVTIKLSLMKDACGHWQLTLHRPFSE